MSIKYDHQAFEEGISKSSLYCIAFYVLILQSFDHKTKHLKIILLLLADVE